MGWSGTRNMTVQGRAMSIMGSGINLYYQRDCGAENRNPQIKSTSSSTSVSTKGWTWWNGERAQTNPPPTKKTIKTSWSCWICACVCTCVHEAVREEVDTGSMQPPAVISQQTICMCVRVVGITTWGFLTFCLQLWMVPETGALWPLHYDHWEMGGGSPCEWEGEESASCIEYNWLVRWHSFSGVFSIGNGHSQTTRYGKTKSWMEEKYRDYHFINVSAVCWLLNNW